MALLERVSTLLRANLNELLDRAEDPEMLSKQILLDMENQLLQVKTQVAVAVADQHRLQQQRAEHEDGQTQWRKRAEAAVVKGEDDLARAALERSLSHARLAEGFRQQHDDQVAEAETLRRAYTKLQGKLMETRARIELLLAQHRRMKAMAMAERGGGTVMERGKAARISRLSSTVDAGRAEALRSRAMRSVAAEETVEERFEGMERNDEIEALLLELKETQRLLGS